MKKYQIPAALEANFANQSILANQAYASLFVNIYFDGLQIEIIQIEKPIIFNGFLCFFLVDNSFDPERSCITTCLVISPAN